MFMSKAQQFLMFELYLYTRMTCFSQLVTIFRSKIQNTRWDPIYTYVAYYI